MRHKYECTLIALNSLVKTKQVYASVLTDVLNEIFYNNKYLK